MGNHDDAEDICQEVCLHCRLGQATFRGQAELATWLYHITVSACRYLLRKKGKRKESVEAEIGEEALKAAQEAQAWAQAEPMERCALRAQAQAALAQLTSRQRQLLIWKYGEGYSHAEIAQRLGIKEQSVRQSLHRARAAFIKAYEALDKEEP